MDKKAIIEILYFASLRERVSCERESLALADDSGAATVTDIIELLIQRGGAWRAAFQPNERLLCAVNQRMATPDTEVKGGDELAFFPPVTGG